MQEFKETVITQKTNINATVIVFKSIIHKNVIWNSHFFEIHIQIFNDHSMSEDEYKQKNRY